MHTMAVRVAMVAELVAQPAGALVRAVLAVMGLRGLVGMRVWVCNPTSPASRPGTALAPRGAQAAQAKAPAKPPPEACPARLTPLAEASPPPRPEAEAQPQLAWTQAQARMAWWS